MSADVRTKAVGCLLVAARRSQVRRDLVDRPVRFKMIGGLNHQPDPREAILPPEAQRPTSSLPVWQPGWLMLR